MYYVITDSGVYKAPTLAKINKHPNFKLTQEDFKSLGKDYIVTLTNEDISFVKDAKKPSLIPFERLYRKESYKLYFYILIFMSFINMVRG